MLITRVLIIMERVEVMEGQRRELFSGCRSRFYISVKIALITHAVTRDPFFSSRNPGTELPPLPRNAATLAGLLRCHSPDLGKVNGVASYPCRHRPLGYEERIKIVCRIYCYYRGVEMIACESIFNHTMYVFYLQMQPSINFLFGDAQDTAALRLIYGNVIVRTYRTVILIWFAISQTETVAINPRIDFRTLIIAQANRSKNGICNVLDYLKLVSVCRLG